MQTRMLRVMRRCFNGWLESQPSQQGNTEILGHAHW